MNSDQRVIELWNDYLEGELDESGIAELRERIAEDDRLLRMAADSYQIHRLLGLIAQDSESRKEDFVRQTLARLPADDAHFINGVMRHLSLGPSRKNSNTRRFLSKWPIPIAVVAVLMLIAGIVIPRIKTERGIARVTELNGSIRWTGDRGQVVSALEAGQLLRGGTLESLSADSWINLEFHDGSIITASGQSVLTISDDRQKELHLRSGNLSASVKPQPAGKPMLIHTPTAVLEVLGTQLNVEAEQASTTLSVNQGNVRVTRLADGRVIEVPAEYRAIASVDRNAELAANPRPKPITAWQGNLISDESYGKLRPKPGDNPVGLRAAPMLWMEKERALTLYLVALSVSRNQSAPVLLTSGGKFRIRGQIESAGDVYFGLTTRRTNGGFAGKFLVHRRLEARDTGKTLDIELCLDDFRPQEEELTKKFPEKFPDSPADLELVDWWCCTINEDAGLEISQVALDAGIIEPNGRLDNPTK